MKKIKLKVLVAAQAEEIEILRQLVVYASEQVRLLKDRLAKAEKVL